MSTNSYNDVPGLIVEIDLAPVLATINKPQPNNYYCVTHDWYPYTNTPCRICANNQHTPKQKYMACQFCLRRFLTYWGDHPYTCYMCLPTEKHEANRTEFMRELEN